MQDFLAGLFILLEDQYGVGDTIDLGTEVAGVVEEVNLRVDAGAWRRRHRVVRAER